MNILRQSKKQFDGINASPFCAKLELFLSYYNIPYQVKFALPNQGPYKKIPYIEQDGEVQGDSELIIERLLKQYDVQQGLTELQHAQGRAWQMMLEQHLNWILVYCRWIPEAEWQRLEPAFFKGYKWPLRALIGRYARNLVRKNLYTQGLGRFTTQQILLEGDKDLQALSDHLSANRFICGEQFSRYDLFAYVMIISINSKDIPTRLTEYIQKYPVLLEYQQRVEAELAIGYNNESIAC